MITPPLLEKMRQSTANLTELKQDTLLYTNADDRNMLTLLSDLTSFRVKKMS